MKKIILTIISLTILVNVSAQLKVSSLGQVGIGTTTPQYKLDVAGDARVTGNIYIGNTTSNFIGTTSDVPIIFKINGTSAGYTGYSGGSSVSFGYNALNNSYGSGNVAIGIRSLQKNTSGNANVSVGFMALNNNTTGNSNLANGYQALYNNTTGNSNVATGNQALYRNTGGTGNLANGGLALYNNTTGNYNLANGYYALFNNKTGTNNIANGYQTLYSNTTGNSNIATGHQALYRNTDGSDNLANGYYALYNNTEGTYNIATGYRTLYYNQTGSTNIAYGNQALYNNTAGSYNVAYGTGALLNNITGNANIAIGYNADVSASNLNFTTAIGYGASATASNQVRIGNSSVTSIGGYAAWSNLSDGRAKKNIQANVPGLSFINQLQAVTYNLDLNAVDGLLKIKESDRIEKSDRDIQPVSQELIAIEKKAREAKESQVQTGFVAQEVEQIAKSIGYDFSGVEVDESGIYSLRYAEFVVPLVKAVQELSEQNTQLQEQNDQLQKQIDELKERSILRSITDEAEITGMVNPVADLCKLYQNAPNPFNQDTQIQFYIPKNIKEAQLCIYNLQGMQIKQIVITQRGEGSQWISGSELIAGMYLYALIADDKEVDTKRMILTK